MYAPREVFPISDILGAIVSTLCASVALVVLFLIDGRLPSATSYWAIPLLVILLVFTTGVTLLVAGLTVYLRDMRHALPLMPPGRAVPHADPLRPLTKIPAEYRDRLRRGQPARGDHRRHAPVRALRPGAARRATRSSRPSCRASGCFGSFMLFKRLETGFADVS